MIARIWHGKVPKEKSEAYHQYLIGTGLHDYEKIEGTLYGDLAAVGR